MDDSGIWTRRPQHINPEFERLNSDRRCSRYMTWAGPIDTQLYSDSLTYLSKCTELNIAQLMRPSEQSHSAEPNSYRRSFPCGQSSLADFGLVFAPKDTFNFLARSTVTDDDSSSCGSVSAPLSHCYLCQTLDEHKIHLLKQRVPKKLPKPRIIYEAPCPKVIPKLAEEPVAILDSRYKVIVWTGNKPGASTNANVYITIKGNQNILPKTCLRHGGAKDQAVCFISGARDVFYVRSPALGDLEILTLELEPNRKGQCGWYCEKIQVICLKDLQSWIFECNNWLSLRHGDHQLSRDLTAVNLKRKTQEFEVTVTTGSKNLAGTDADVFVTFYGAKGNSPKIQLVAKTSRKLFQRKGVDQFFVSFNDIGEIRTLRIEHNGKGLAPGWFLENVVVKDVNNPQTVYYFLLHGWLSLDAGDGRLWREIKAKKTLVGEITSGKLIKYKVTVRTGELRYAGTDANVYIIIQGEKGKTKKLFMNDNRNNFERGATEEFELEAIDTGSVNSIHIGHDNTGPGSGWYCEDVIVEKYLSREEQVKFLNKLKNKIQEQNRSHSSDSKKQHPSHRKNDKNDGNDDSEEEFGQSSYRDVFSPDGSVMKVPIHERYYFECKAWLAKDEGDGLVVRELEVKNKTVIFRKK